MIPHVGPQLARLAALCDPEDEGTFNGWSVDCWGINAEALDELRTLYRALLMGGLERDIEDALILEGVDVGSLLFDDDSARDVITRSDLTELTAAAAAIGVDEWPESTMLLPNVPKGSRSRSEVGIDVLAVRMEFDSNEIALLPDEWLFIGSVKHTIDDPGDCRYKLVKSVSPSDLTTPYVGQQLRVLNGHLSLQGLNARRLYLFLRSFPDADHVAITITAAVDIEHRAALLGQMTNLPLIAHPRHCRHVIFGHLANLHELINDD